MPSVQSRSGKVCEQSVIVLHFLPLIPFHALPRFPVVLPHVPVSPAGAWLVRPAAQSSLCAHPAPAWATWEELWLLEALNSTWGRGKLELIIQELLVQAPFTAFSLGFTNSWLSIIGSAVVWRVLPCCWGGLGVSLRVILIFVAFEMLSRRKWTRWFETSNLLQPFDLQYFCLLRLKSEFLRITLGKWRPQKNLLKLKPAWDFPPSFSKTNKTRVCKTNKNCCE